MTSYEEMYESFSWEDLWDNFDWDAPRQFNLTHEIVTRNVGMGPAFHWDGRREGEVKTVTYHDLERASSQVANALAELGAEGEEIATLVPRIPELYETFLGIWRSGGVYVPLFTAFGPESVRSRVSDAGVNTIITTPEHRETIAAVEDDIDFNHVIVIGRDETGVSGGDIAYTDLIGGQSTSYETARTSADDLCALEYTSGTTGPPKGCKINHRILASILPYTLYAMALDEDEVLWGAADPGWMYGLFSAGVIPVSQGIPNVIYEGEFNPEEWYRVLEKYDVTSLASSPTAYRGLVNAGDLYESYELSLVKANSAGEPLNPEVIRWFQNHLDVAVYDQYGVTEVGMVVCNHHYTDDELKLGSMGRALPGFDVRILAETEPADIGENGEIAVRRGEGTFFDGYLGLPEKTAEAWVEHDGDQWFVTGDAAYRDDEGYFWFVGRADDVIVSSGYRIGPFEVESTLIEHDAVSEAAAIGIPDEERGEIVKAFVVLAPDAEARDDLADEIQQFVREQLAKHAYPREVEFIDKLPTTSTGKIRRTELREREQQ